MPLAGATFSRWSTLCHASTKWGGDFGFNSEFGSSPIPPMPLDVSVNGWQGVVANGIWNPYSTVGHDVNGIFQRSGFGTSVAGNPFGAQG